MGTIGGQPPCIIPVSIHVVIPLVSSLHLLLWNLLLWYLLSSRCRCFNSCLISRRRLLDIFPTNRGLLLHYCFTRVMVSWCCCCWGLPRLLCINSYRWLYCRLLMGLLCWGHMLFVLWVLQAGSWLLPGIYCWLLVQILLVILLLVCKMPTVYFISMLLLQLLCRVLLRCCCMESRLLLLLLLLLCSNVALQRLASRLTRWSSSPALLCNTGICM